MQLESEPQIPKLWLEDACLREPTFINLSEAYLCSDCEAVGNSGNRCPRCQSSALMAITRAMPRHRDSIRIVCRALEEDVRLNVA
jgi:DnaJ-class molecular chaperone